MRRSLMAVGSAIFLLVGLVFVGDFAWLGWRARHQQNVYDQLQIQIVERIPQKGNKAEYVPQEPQMQSCVRSIFPTKAGSPAGTYGAILNNRSISELPKVAPNARCLRFI